MTTRLTHPDGIECQNVVFQIELLSSRVLPGDKNIKPGQQYMQPQQDCARIHGEQLQKQQQ